MTAREPACEHYRAFGEGVEWPAEVSLAHFDDCTDPLTRLQRWTRLREMGNHGWRCLQADHDGDRR